MHLAESDYLEEVEDTRRGRSKHEAEEDQREANEELLKQVDAHFLASFWAEPAPRWPRSGFCSRELFCLRLWPTWQCCGVAMLRSQDGDVELNLGSLSHQATCVDSAVELHWDGATACARLLQSSLETCRTGFVMTRSLYPLGRTRPRRLTKRDTL